MKTLIDKTYVPYAYCSIIYSMTRRRQPKCPSMGEWRKTRRHAHMTERYSVIKKKETLPCVTTWRVLEGTMLHEISQRKTNTVWFHLYVESKKQNKWQTNKQQQPEKPREQTRGHQRWGEWRMAEIGEGIKRHKLPVLTYRSCRGKKFSVGHI